MKFSLLVQTDSWLIALLLFVVMMVATWIGMKIGHMRRKRKGDNGVSGESSGLTALLFFLLAFTFSMSGSRFDTRRKTVVEEANAIGTALLRADMYVPDERLLFRKDFEQYVEARIQYYEVGANLKGIADADSLSQTLSSGLWARAVRLAADPGNLVATQQMIPALNAMIDITTTRLAGEKARVPDNILYMLFFIAAISAFYGGYFAGRKGTMDWLVETGFCLLVALVILFTMDFDRPRRGIVNLDVSNQTIVNLRRNF